jgi:hypothetical protein
MKKTTSFCFILTFAVLASCFAKYDKRSDLLNGNVKNDSIDFYLELAIRNSESYHLQFVNHRLCLSHQRVYLGDSLFYDDLTEVSRYCNDSVIHGPALIRLFIGKYSSDVSCIGVELARWREEMKSDTMLMVLPPEIKR